MSMIIGVSLCVSSILFLALAIITISERSRFSPFYKPIQCTNPNLFIPFGFAAYPTANPPLPSFMYFDSFADFASYNATDGTGGKPSIYVGIDAGTGYPVTAGPYNMSAVALPANALGVGNPPVDLTFTNVLTNPAVYGGLNHPAGGAFMLPPTQAQYDASLPIPHVISCTNKNEYDITIKKGNADIEVTLDGQNFMNIGSASFGTSDVKLAAKTSDVSANLLLKMQINKVIGEALAPSLMSGVAPGNVGQPMTLPIFISFTELKTELEMSFLGMSQIEKDKLPLKHCGLHVKNVYQSTATGAISGAATGTAYWYWGLQPATALICENSKAAIVTKMFDTALITSEMTKYAAVEPSTKHYDHIGGGHVDDLNPTQKTIDDAVSQLDTMTGILCAFFFVLFFGLLGGGLFFIKKANDSKDGDN